jgi:hypothetical protein
MDSSSTNKGRNIKLPLDKRTPLRKCINAKEGRKWRKYKNFGSIPIRV